MTSRRAASIVNNMNFKVIALLCLLAFFNGCQDDSENQQSKQMPEPRLAETTAFKVRTPALDDAIDQARNALAFRNAGEARKPISTLLQQLPHDIQGHALVAYADWLDGRYTEAKARAAKVVELLEPYTQANKEDIKARQVYARALTVLGRVGRAESQLRIVIRQGSREPVTIDQWVSLLIQRENLAEHRELFEQVFSGDKAHQDPILCAAKGLGLIYLDEMDTASKSLSECIQQGTEAQQKSGKTINPTLARLQATQGVVALRSGQLLKARDHFEDAIDSSHKDADAHHALAVTMWRLRDVRARESLERALEIRIDPESAFLLGQVHTFNKRIDSAIAQVKLALDHLDLWTQPRADRWQVPFLLGRLLARKGQFAQAQQALEQALELDPNPKSHREIYRHLVWVRQKSSGGSAR
jgi:tetratricopeptide (TPR) repeat protein